MSDVIVRIPGIKRAELEGMVNMFVATLRTRSGSSILCHLHDTGLLARIMPSGTPAYYVEVPKRGGRFTGCDVVALLDNRTMVLVDSRIPNIVFSRLIPRFFGDVDVSSGVVRELQVKAPFLRYRADFIILGYGREPVIVEVKGVNYARGNIGLFPSAKSERASRQLEALKILSSKSNFKTMVVFIALRSDIGEVQPNIRVDPKFSRRLCSYKDIIEYRAYKVRSELRGSTLYVYYDGEIPVNPCPQAQWV